MAIQHVLYYPDPRLRIKAQPVPEEKIRSKAIQEIIQNMLDTLYAVENGGGLAATQIGVAWRIFVMHVSDHATAPECFINPEIIERSEEETFKPEGCLSVPGGVYGLVKRARRVKLKAFDRDGQLIERVEDNNYHARCFQHEIDHLDGILFIDHMKGLSRRRADQKVARWHKKQRKGR